MSPKSDDSPAAPRLRLRILFGEDAMLGPGKAELLERVRETGSIAAAGRAMRMSYKRAWMLVEEMNAAFSAPLVDSARGGAGGGGAGGHAVFRGQGSGVRGQGLGCGGWGLGVRG